MYYPYLRGKQFDLIVVRETADILARSGFVPIIEPVKENYSGLSRALDEVQKNDGKAVLIMNPQNGVHAGNIIQFNIEKYGCISPGIILDEKARLEDAIALCEQYASREITLVHAGYSSGKDLNAELSSKKINSRHIFIENNGSKIYRRNFSKAERILIKDGFQKRANKLHPETEFFSDLHVTYQDEGMNGFGDFLIVGDDYSEGGGPAYAVAIHLTFIDEDNDDVMFIHHFKSDRFETPTDPAGKFAEAVKKLVDAVNMKGSKIYRTEAVKEFIDLHKQGHFPGLGYVKKLSMQHHIETLATYFDK